MKNGPERAHPVLPTYLFSFAIGSAGIADGHFEDSAAAFGKFDRQFRLYIESRAFERNALEQASANHFVASLHVRQVEIRDDVAHESQKFVSELVSKEQGSLVAPGHEARAENRIGILHQEQFNHLQQIDWVIFEVGIVNHDKLGIHPG